MFVVAHDDGDLHRIYLEIERIKAVIDLNLFFCGMVAVSSLWQNWSTSL